MRNVIMGLGIMAAISNVSSVQSATISSRINVKNFTSDYSAEWYVYDNQDGTGPKLRATLRLKNVDTRDWTVNN